MQVGLIFCAALGVGLPYYVPTGMFAIRFGGESSGVLSAYMDALSFFVSGPFIYALRPVLDAKDSAYGGWWGAWSLMGCVGLLMSAVNFSFVTMLLSTWRTKSRHHHHLRRTEVRVGSRAEDMRS